MGTFLHNASLIQYHNLIGILHRAEPMRHYHHGFSFIEFMQMFHNLFFIICIQGIGGFVEEKKFRIFIHSTCYQQTLFLPLADTIPLHTDFGVISQWKRIYKITDIGHRHGVT